MNTFIYYKFEKFSKEEYYNKNKYILKGIYSNDGISSIHNKIVNKYTFYAVEALTLGILFRNFDFKKFEFFKFTNKIIKFGIVSILSINLFLRNFQNEIKNECDSNKIINFSKSLVNQDFCLQKDTYLILAIFSIKKLFESPIKLNTVDTTGPIQQEENREELILSQNNILLTNHNEK